MSCVKLPNRCIAIAGREWRTLSVEDAEHLVFTQNDDYVGFVTLENEQRGVFLCKRGYDFYDQAGCTVDYFVPVHTTQENLFEDDFTATLKDQTTRLRPHDQTTTNMDVLCLFSSVSPNVIQIGESIHNWLSASLAVLANFPSAAMDLIKQKTLASDGKYDVRFFHPIQEQWCVVSVDDRFPIYRGSNKLKYIEPTLDGEIWPCIVGKALAKLLGGYSRIEDQVVTLALKSFTGCMGDQLLWISRKFGVENSWTCRCTNFKEPKTGAILQEDLSADWPDGGGEDRTINDVYAFICDFDEQNFLMCARSGDAGTMSHVHTVLQVAKDVCGSGIDLLQLHNPWGEAVWKGDWSDSSGLWDKHQEIKIFLRPEFGEDGSFWISKTDFAKTYTSIYACRIDMGENRAKESMLALATEDRLSKDGVPVMGQKHKEPVDDLRRRKEEARGSRGACCAIKCRDDQLALSKGTCLQC